MSIRNVRHCPVGIACASASAFLAVAALSACGKASSPDDVEITKLKPALNLQVLPGDGSLTLKWTAVNNEDDFSGYNIYLGTAEFSTIQGAFGLSAVASEDPDRFSPIVFQDAEGKDIESVRPNLATYFNWDPTTKANLASANKKDFNALVRCNVETQDKGGKCIAVNGTNDKFRANGPVTYTISGLDNGKKYTIFVTSTMKDGKKIASPTSNVMTVAPRKEQVIDPAFTSPNHDGYDLATGIPVKKTFVTSNTSLFCLPENGAEGAAADIYFEVNGGSPSLIGANGTRIADLGPVQKPNGEMETSGLLSQDMRINGTALLPVAENVAAVSGKPADGDIGSTTGYSRCGQSVFMADHHLYAIAYLDGAKTRYSLLETGTWNGTKFDSIKIVVARDQDRRL